MKKSAIFLGAVAALMVASWVLALLTLLLMRWVAVWPVARAAIVDESVLVASAVLAMFVAEALAILGALIYTVTKFPETIGAAVDVFSAARGRFQPHRARRPSR